MGYLNVTNMEKYFAGFLRKLLAGYYKICNNRNNSTGAFLEKQGEVFRYVSEGKGVKFCMEKTAVVTDSNSGISQEKAKKYGVYVLPMPFYIDDVLYLEGQTITHEEFFRKQFRCQADWAARVIRRWHLRSSMASIPLSIASHPGYGAYGLALIRRMER